MAAAGESTCHSDPNFAVICSFLDKYSELLGLPEISYVDLQEYLEDTKTVSRALIDIHVRLLKRIGKTNVNHERFERSVTKFCFYFSERDGWEVERFGYRHAQLSTKLRILKNLLECQFDYNVKFKEKVNELCPEEMRFLPAGRDKDGMTYWYLLDKDLNVFVYREEPDDENAESWKLVCSDRHQLAQLVDRLKNNTQKAFKEEGKDDRCSIFTDESKSTSKEGSPAVEEKLTDIKPLKIKLGDVSVQACSGTCEVPTVSDVKLEKNQDADKNSENVRKETPRSNKASSENDTVRSEVKVKQERLEAYPISETAVVGRGEPQGKSAVKVAEGQSCHKDSKVKEQIKKRKKNRSQETPSAGSSKTIKKVEKEQPQEKPPAVHENAASDKTKGSDICDREGKNVSLGESTEASKELAVNGEEKLDDKTAENRALNNFEDSDKKDKKCCVLSSNSAENYIEKIGPIDLSDCEARSKTLLPVTEGKGGKANFEEMACGYQGEKEEEEMLLSHVGVERVCEMQEEVQTITEVPVEKEVDSRVMSTDAIDFTIRAKDKECLTRVTDSSEVKEQEKCVQQDLDRKLSLTEFQNQTSCAQEENSAKVSPPQFAVSVLPQNIKKEDKEQSVSKESQQTEDKENVLEKSEENDEAQKLDACESTFAQEQVYAKDGKHQDKEKLLKTLVTSEAVCKGDVSVETVSTKSPGLQTILEKLTESKQMDNNELHETKNIDTAAALSHKAELSIQAAGLDSKKEGILTAESFENLDKSEVVKLEKSKHDQSSSRQDSKGYMRGETSEGVILTQADNIEEESGSIVSHPAKPVDEPCRNFSSEAEVKLEEKCHLVSDELADSGTKAKSASEKEPEMQANADPSAKISTEKSRKSLEQSDLDKSSEPEKAASSGKPDLKISQNLREEQESTGVFVNKEQVNCEKDICFEDSEKALQIKGGNQLGVTCVSEQTGSERQTCPEHQEGKSSEVQISSVAAVEAVAECVSQRSDVNDSSEAVVPKVEKESVEGTKQSVERAAEKQVMSESVREQGEVSHSEVSPNQSDGKNSETVLGSTDVEKSVSEITSKSEESAVLDQKKCFGKDEEVEYLESARVVPSDAENEKLQWTEEKAMDLSCKAALVNIDGSENHSSGKSTVEIDERMEAGNKTGDESVNMIKEEMSFTDEQVTENKLKAKKQNNIVKVDLASIETPNTDDYRVASSKVSGESKIAKAELTSTEELNKTSSVVSSSEPATQNEVYETEKIAKHESDRVEEGQSGETDGSKTVANSERNLLETESKPQNTCEIKGRKAKRARKKQGDKGNEKVVSDKDSGALDAKVEGEQNHLDNPQVMHDAESVKAKKKPRKPGKQTKKFSEKNDIIENNSQVGGSETKENSELLEKDKKVEGRQENGASVVISKMTEDTRSKGMMNGHHEATEEVFEDNKDKPPCTPTVKGKSVKRGRGGKKGGAQARKRSAPEAASDDTNSEPAEKQVKRGGVKRGKAAARGRSNRKTTKASESSSDSDVPLSRVSGRGGKGRENSKAAKSSKKKKAALALEDGFSSSSDDSPLSRACKKKKIVGEDSSDFEPEEPVAPKKKDRKTIKKKTPGSAHKELESAEETISTRRSLRLQNIKKKEPEPEPELSTEDQSVEDESSEMCLSTEEDSGDEDFSPQGRNRLRQAALKSKKQEEEVPVDDTPCLICEKCTHPDMMLLCDSCDNGYHMACLRPPLMVVPEGDWFCPPCEHNKLIERLSEYLHVLETSSRKKERLVRRRERLAFVGISLDNILKEEKKPVKQEYILEEEEEEEEKYSYQQSRKASHSPGNKHKRYKVHGRDESPLPGEVYAKRSCRTRSNVSYQFKEFDELINQAIEEDIKLPKPPRPPKPPGISRGKDMSNILGMDSDEEKEMLRKQKEEQLAADSMDGRPPPIIKKKPRRRLTTLDSDDNQEEDDDSEEFKLSESDEDSEASAEPSLEEEDLSDESGDWKPQRTWYNKATRKSSRNRSRQSQWSRYDDDFVVDDEYDSDERANKRRSTRNSSKRRIRYKDWESETEESMETDDTEASLSSVDSEDSAVKKKKNNKKLRKKFCSDTESSGSEYMVRISQKKKRRVESSESEEDNESRKPPKSGTADSVKASKVPPPVTVTSQKSKCGPRKPQFSDDDSETEIEKDEEEEKVVPRKRKNVLRDSSSEEEKGVCADNGDNEETEVEEDERKTVESVEEKQSLEPKEEQAVADQEKPIEKKEQISEESVIADRLESFDKRLPVVKLVKVVTGMQTTLVAEKTEPETKPEKTSVEESEQQVQDSEKVSKKVSKSKSKSKGKGTAKTKKLEAHVLEEGREENGRSKSAAVGAPSTEKPEVGTGTDAGGPLSSQALQTASTTKGAMPNFLNVDEAKESPQAALVHPSPLPSLPERIPAPGEVGFRYPGGGDFRHSIEGGFQSPPYDPRFQTPEGQELRSRGFQGPFCHGPYPLLGEQFRGSVPENFQPPGSGDYFHPQGMNSFGPHGQPGQVPRPEAFKQMPQRQERFPACGPEGFRPSHPEGFHPGGPYPPFHGSPQHFYPSASQPFQGHPPTGYGMYPHRFPPGLVQGPFGPGAHPNANNFHPMGTALSQVPGVPPAGRGGFMIDNLLRSNSSGHSFTEEIPQPPPAQAHMTPPQMTPPHVTPPQQALQQPQPPSQQQQQPPPPTSRPLTSPRSPGHDDDDMGDVSDIVSYVMNDEFFKQQTSS